MASDRTSPTTLQPIQNTGVYSFLKGNHTCGLRPTRGDKPTDPQPRGKSKNKRSLTSVTPTPLYLYSHPYAKATQIQAVTTGML